LYCVSCSREYPFCACPETLCLKGTFGQAQKDRKGCNGPEGNAQIESEKEKIKMKKRVTANNLNEFVNG